MGPFSYCWGLQVWFSKLLHIEKTKQMNYTFPNTINGGGLKSKVVFLPEEVGSDLSVTMWYFEQSFGVVCKVPPRSSSHEGLCLFSPEEIYWLWITCVWWDYIIWLVLWSIQQINTQAGAFHFQSLVNCWMLHRTSQLLPRVTSLTLQATPHWENKTNGLHIPQYY